MEKDEKPKNVNENLGTLARKEAENREFREKLIKANLIQKQTPYTPKPATDYSEFKNMVDTLNKELSPKAEEVTLTDNYRAG